MPEVLVMAVEALVPLRHKAVNGWIVKFPGLRCEPVPHVLLDVVVRGDQKWRNRRERGLDCMKGDRKPPGLYLNFCKTALIVLAIWGLALSFALRAFLGEQKWRNRRERGDQKWRNRRLAREHVTTVNAQRYSQTLTTLRQAIKSKRPDKITPGVILLHDNARLNTANTITAIMQKIKWEVLGHPPYSPDLSPCDDAIFGPLKCL
ncbi:hypothetical protein ANN_00825 [Periplaneta americana]|uniref:Tc1-like transposase DDE domain-containing protein n=1 Tax=Periplaneta americana TaxID=6978 RepID=A0ABQ8TRV2_PERAM|nr:hypothetical protein ANN_00825 [Periplaneta americana]